MLHPANSNMININQEISKAFKNINYSQWERQKQTSQSSKQILPKQQEKQLPPLVNSTGRPVSKQSNISVLEPLERKCSPYCNHNQNVHPNKIVFKTKKQLQEEEYQRNILKTKIKFAKESIYELKKREFDLLERNKELIKSIDAVESNANESVDVILRKYEKYQDLLKTINKKHFEELENEQKELNKLKFMTASELPKYEANSNEIEHELKEAQDLNKLLSIYKNQEYPEKLLQINNLRKKLDDIKSVNQEEHDNLLEMIKNDKDRTKHQTIEASKEIANYVSKKALDEMHFSLKDMAQYNIQIKSEMTFYKNLIEDLRNEIDKLQMEIDFLQTDQRRNNRTVIFSELYKTNEICTPDMDVVLDLST